jgi:hypothetical protein
MGQEDQDGLQSDENAKFSQEEIPNGWMHMSDWERTQQENGWTYSGSCPRCGHTMSKYFPDVGHVIEMYRGVDVLAREESNDIVRCNCGAPHDGREGAGGCGAYWSITTVRPDQSVVDE